MLFIQLTAVHASFLPCGLGLIEGHVDRGRPSPEGEAPMHSMLGFLSDDGTDVSNWIPVETASNDQKWTSELAGIIGQRIVREHLD